LLVHRTPAGSTSQPPALPRIVRYQEYTRAHSHDMPKLPRRSDEADASWVERVESTAPTIQLPEFRELYDRVYDYYAEYDHPSTAGLGLFVHRDVDEQIVVVDGKPERDLSEDLRPYWLAVFALADALVVSSLASGHPRVGALRGALEIIGSVRLANRDGRLRVTTTDSRLTIAIEDCGDTEDQS
jgi:hypothetical protein